MKMTKKVLSVLLSLMLVLGAVAVGGMSASALNSEAQLIIGDEAAIIAGNVVKFEGTGWSISENGDDVMLNLDNLVLEISSSCISAVHLDLTITGTANLTSDTCAITVIYGNLTLDDAILRLRSKYNGAVSADNLTINGGFVYAVTDSKYNNVITTDQLTVNNGSLYAKTNSANQPAIFADIGITLNNGEGYAVGGENAKEVLIKKPGTLAGKGTADWPYMIFDYSDLKLFASIVNGSVGQTQNSGACAKLMKDIECKYNPDDEEYAKDWTPIGNISYSYVGTFDGDGHVITGLTYNNPQQNYAGLFGVVHGVKEGDETVGGIVKNVGLEGGSIAGHNTVGGLVGWISIGGLISGCYNNGVVSGTKYVGGVVGVNQGNVTSCYNTGSVSGESWVGGVVGNNDGPVTNCYNSGSGNISAQENQAGGVVGFNTDEITNCYNFGAGNISGSYAGGIVGENHGTVTNCYNSGAGNISGTTAGGVVGNNDGLVTSCYNTCSGSLTGSHLGGVAGHNTGTLSNCYNSSNLGGEKYVGGVVGSTQGQSENSIVDSCYNTGNVTVTGTSGEACVGGVVGNNQSGFIVSNCYNTGNVSGNNFVGGVVGYNSYNSSVENCYYDKSVCGEIGAVYGADDYTNNVTGLTTAEMTGIDALSDSNMKFVFESGETNPWLTKADGAEDGGEYYWFYPHLKGFNFNNDLAQMTADEIEAADWPAKAEVSVTLSEYSYEYDGAPKKPYVTSVKIGGKTLEPDRDYTVSYCNESGMNDLPVNAGNYKAVITSLKEKVAGEGVEYVRDESHAPIEKEFKITPKAVTVTAASEEFTYDGTAHSNDGYEVRGLVGSDAITAVVTGSITYPSDSPVPNVLESYEFTSGTPGNYNVTTVNGELTMSKASVAITITSASGEWTYDGSAHSDNTVKVTSGELLTGDTLVATATGSVTDVSDTATGNNRIADGYKIMHGEKDVTENYAITPVNGTLTINPAKVTVTITGKHNSAPYDGEEHTVSGYNVEISNPLYSISDFKYNGVASATEADAGRVEMGLSDSLFENNNQNFDVTFNVTDGYQEIVPISVDVTVKGNSATADYDGNEKSVTGYTAKASNSLYDVENDIEFSGSAEVKLTEPGTESMGLDASQFSNKNANFNATFTVEEDGKLTVNPVIKFINEDGAELQSGAVAYGETPEYKGETPVKTANDGYAYEFAAWTPVITPATENATYTATYTKTAIEYTATFVDEKGETIAEVPYTVETEKLEAPAVPGKEGYNGEWEEYELTPGGITVKPVYTPADICPLDNEYHGDNFWGRLVKFFHTVIWKAFNLLGMNIYLKIW